MEEDRFDFGRGARDRVELSLGGRLRAAGAFVVAFLNRKGGVGKTSCCHHLAGCYAKAGRRVLLVDADPQASLTHGFWGPRRTETLAKEETLASLFEDDLDPTPERLIFQTTVEGVSLLPSSAHLDACNLPVSRDEAPLQLALRDFLDEVRGAFDVILIDCPPNLYLCSWNALLAADFVVVPFQPEDYGSQGVSAIQVAILKARDRLNPRLRLLGYLLTMVQNRLGLHAAFERQLRQLYGTDVFETRIPRAKDFAEAVSARVPITTWRPQSTGARAISDLAAEIERRVAAFALGGWPGRIAADAGRGRQ
jgi:chromosome partitioning protein